MSLKQDSGSSQLRNVEVEADEAEEEKLPGAVPESPRPESVDKVDTLSFNFSPFSHFFELEGFYPGTVAPSSNGPVKMPTVRKIQVSTVAPPCVAWVYAGFFQNLNAA